MIETRRCGVLGPPHAGGMTVVCGVAPRLQADAAPMLGTAAASATAASAHHPAHSGLRGRSTVLTFSSLIVPLAIKSLRSPSVGPDTLAR